MKQDTLAKKRKLVPETLASVLSEVPRKIPPLRAEGGMGPVIPGEAPLPGTHRLLPFGTADPIGQAIEQGEAKDQGSQQQKEGFSANIC